MQLHNRDCQEEKGLVRMARRDFRVLFSFNLRCVEDAKLHHITVFEIYQLGYFGKPGRESFS